LCKTPRPKKTITIIGEEPLTVPGMAISPEQAEKNIRNLFKSMAIPGVAEVI